MARIHIVHPSAAQRDELAQPLRQQGWNITESGSRTELLQRLSGPAAHRFGDLVLVDLQDWSVPGTALIKALRRQLASPLPVLVRLPRSPESADLASQAARLAGANLLLGGRSDATAVVQAAACLGGWEAIDPAQRALRDALLVGVWQAQMDLIALPDHAAATVVSARRVFEGLLAQRLDERAADAALALTGIAGGPVPLGRWAGWYHPAHETFAGEATLTRRRQAVWPLCLLVDAGGQRYALPLEAEVCPGAWWSDGDPLPGHADPQLPALPMVRLLGGSRFRRLLATDRATVMLRREEQGQVAEHAVRVDEVLGIEPLAVDRCPTWTARASGLVGTAVDRDGEPVLVLDGDALWRELHIALAGAAR